MKVQWTKPPILVATGTQRGIMGPRRDGHPRCRHQPWRKELVATPSPTANGLWVPRPVSNQSVLAVVSLWVSATPALGHQWGCVVVGPSVWRSFWRRNAGTSSPAATTMNEQPDKVQRTKKDFWKGVVVENTFVMPNIAPAGTTTNPSP